MKKTGSTSDFSKQRDKELYARFLDLLRSPGETPLRDLFGMAASKPASRFWVSERRAADVIGAMLSGKGEATREKMYPKRREMYDELLRRVKALMLERPGLCMTHAVDEAVNSEAPEFYMTPESARCIIYRIRRRMRVARMLASKIRH